MEKKAVHCLTQEEWDFVLSKLPSHTTLSKEGNKFKSYITAYPEGVAVCYNSSTYCGLDYLRQNNYQIISFNNFCKEKGIENPFEKKSLVGRYLKALIDNSQGCYSIGKGDYTKIVNLFRNNEYKLEEGYTYYTDAHNPEHWELMPEGFNPDDVKEKEEKEWIPQIGDWVITRNYSSKYDGKPLQITKIKAGRFYYFTPSQSNTANFGRNHILRKAEPHEIPVNSISSSLPIEGEYYKVEDTYVRDLIQAEELVKIAKKDLDQHKSTIDFLKSKLEKINTDVVETTENA